MKFLGLQQRLRQALKEDGLPSDITSLAIPRVRYKKVDAFVQAKQPGVVSGLFLAPLIFKELDKTSKVRFLSRDGRRVSTGQRVLKIRCSMLAMLGGERLFLNLLCHLSGIATLTNQFVQTVKGTSAKILDTRKTTPLWRDLEKYAVRCGGGINHRFSLADAVLVKDNHHQLLRELGMKTEVIYGLKSSVRRSKKLQFTEIEAATLAEVWEAVKARPDIILLDNMPLNRLKEAIVFIKAAREALKSSKPLIEISGGVNLQNSKTYAKLGVDRISVGALTHSAPAMDFSLEVSHGYF